MNQPEKTDVDRLNAYFCGELSALESYDRALEAVADDPHLAVELRTCRLSHQTRAELLRGEIERLGGEPARGAGPWPSLARLEDGGSRPAAALAALEEGERAVHGDLDGEVDELAPAVRTLVRDRIAREQDRTRDLVTRLRERL